MKKDITIDNTQIFEVKDKIEELVFEIYRAGVNYGLSIAEIFNEKNEGSASE